MDYTKYCALTFNGTLLDQVLEGYQTINVEGRGLINRALTTVAVPGRDGELVLSQTIPPRHITVYFFLRANSSMDFMSRLHKLHDALKSESDVQFKFGDEDYYRVGRLAEVANPPYDSREGIGSFTVLCSDPYKYAPEIQISGSSLEIPGTSDFAYKVHAIETVFTTAHTGLIVSNSSTGRKLVLTGSFSAGQKLEILLHEGKVLLNGQNAMNRLNFVQTDWREFSVKPGDVISSPAPITMKMSERFL